MKGPFEFGFAGQPARSVAGPIAAYEVANAAAAAGLPVAEYVSIRRDEALQAFEARNPQWRASTEANVAQSAGPTVTPQEVEPYVPGLTR